MILCRFPEVAMVMGRTTSPLSSRPRSQSVPPCVPSSPIVSIQACRWWSMTLAMKWAMRIAACRRGFISSVVVVQGQADLLQVVDALRTAGRFAGGLYGRQQKRDEHADDGNHHQELDERKAETF